MYKEDSIEEEEEEDQGGANNQRALRGSLPSSWRGAISAGMLFRYAATRTGKAGDGVATLRALG
jgi:hypothetical protein